MSDNIFLETSKSLDNKDIEEIQEELNIKFNEEFIRHYMKFNGGYPQRRFFACADGGTTRINSFDPIKYDNVGTLESNYKSLILLEEYLPKGIVPFAADDIGNLFCISFRDIDYGYVYYCDNENYKVANKEDCLTLIDESFQHFVDNLIQKK